MTNEIQNIIEKCAYVVAAFRPTKLKSSSLTEYKNEAIDFFGTIAPEQVEIEIAALEIMGIVERKKNVLSLVVDYPNASDSVAFLRAHYAALKNEDNQNYEMLCDGLDPYVEPASQPSDDKWYADRVDSFEQFVGLCVETAERRYYRESYKQAFSALEGPVYNPVPRTIFAQCVDAYEFIIGPHMEIYEPENIVHKTLIKSGIVSIRHGNQLYGCIYRGYPGGETQINEHRKDYKQTMCGSEANSGFAWSLAQNTRTAREFIKKCAKAAASEMEAERLERFHHQLDEIGCS